VRDHLPIQKGPEHLPEDLVFFAIQVAFHHRLQFFWAL